METFEIARLDRYFRAVRDALAPVVAGARAVVVTHMLPERPSFIRAVDQLAAVAGVLPKPKSADRDAVRMTGLSYQVDPLSREQFADPVTAVAYLEQRAGGKPVVLLDVGGYFASVLAELCSRFSGRILGVAEDTRSTSCTAPAWAPSFSWSRQRS